MNTYLSPDTVLLAQGSEAISVFVNDACSEPVLLRVRALGVTGIACRTSDIITLHSPLTKETHYLIDRDQIAKMKLGVMLINTSRGGLIQTKAVIDALKTRHIGYLGLDVYEEETGLFFEDHSNTILQDDIIARLLTFPNVLITSHQAFLTHTALQNIADTTFQTLNSWATGEKSTYELF